MARQHHAHKKPQQHRGRFALDQVQRLMGENLALRAEVASLRAQLAQHQQQTTQQAPAAGITREPLFFAWAETLLIAIIAAAAVAQAAHAWRGGSN